MSHDADPVFSGDLLVALVGLEILQVVLASLEDAEDFCGGHCHANTKEEEGGTLVIKIVLLATLIWR